MQAVSQEERGGGGGESGGGNRKQACCITWYTHTIYRHYNLILLFPLCTVCIILNSLWTVRYYSHLLDHYSPSVLYSACYYKDSQVLHSPSSTPGNQVTGQLPHGTGILSMGLTKRMRRTTKTFIIALLTMIMNMMMMLISSCNTMLKVTLNNWAHNSPFSI